MKCPFLESKRIYLRTLDFEDLKGNYIKWLNDEEVCKYNSHHVFTYSPEDAMQYIKDSKQSKTAIVLAIIEKETDTHIGNIALQSIDLVNKSAEFAVLLGEKSFWGKGFAKEALTLLLKHGFNEMNLHRIYCGTSSENKAMQKLAISLGMKEEGCRREALYKHGLYSDMIEYGILKDEFRATNSR